MKNLTLFVVTIMLFVTWLMIISFVYTNPTLGCIKINTSSDMAKYVCPNETFYMENN